MNLAIDSIKCAGMPLSVSEIWNMAKEKGFDKSLKSSGKTPEKTLCARIYVDLKNNASDSIFIQVSKRPAKFYLKDLPSSGNDHILESESKSTYKEKDLHKILSSFLFSDTHFNCYTKTIPHEQSKRRNKGQNSWLHPDVVGVRYPFDDFCPDTRRLMKTLEVNKCKFFSYEIKIAVNFSNLREYFFQALSNSSWANEGYLVAAEYEQSPDFFDELLRLNQSFGIGFIKLDVHDYMQSEILLSAKSNTDLDWATVDRLCQENEVFRSFMNSVRKELSQSELNANEDYQPTEKYDQVFKTDEEFQKYIKEKNIK